MQKNFNIKIIIWLHKNIQTIQDCSISSDEKYAMLRLRIDLCAYGALAPITRTPSLRPHISHMFFQSKIKSGSEKYNIMLFCVHHSTHTACTKSATILTEWDKVQDHEVESRINLES